MKKLNLLLAVLVVVSLAISPVLFGKSHRVEFMSDFTVNGVQLESGTYKVEINGDNVAEFYKGNKLVAEAGAKVEPLGSATPNSVSQKKDGTLVEIRLKNEKVVLATS